MVVVLFLCMVPVENVVIEIYLQVFQVATVQLVDVRRLHGNLLEFQNVGLGSF